MKYLMITSKHHDGFAMWDTKTTDYNIVKQSNYGKDPMKELSTECNKLGVKLAFYFSIIDWTKQTPEPYGNVNPIDEDLMTTVIKPQLDRAPHQLRPDRRAVVRHGRPHRRAVSAHGPVGPRAPARNDGQFARVEQGRRLRGRRRQLGDHGLPHGALGVDSLDLPVLLGILLVGEPRQ